jgi:glyoxylase-like metal-dependent hydrolase (beta-lactamase superfamily II)
MTATLEDPAAAFARRIEVARQSGVPEEPLQRFAEQRRGMGVGIAGLVEPARELVDGVTFTTDLGEWTVHETPGHAPSHVCFFQPERRLLISGDHLLGRVSLYYDYGYTPDPAGEFLRSLEVVDRLDARLCLAGHARPFADARTHVRGNQALVRERLAGVAAAIADGPITAFDVVPRVYGEGLSPMTASWWLSETLCYLHHLAHEGRAQRLDGDPERWQAAGG